MGIKLTIYSENEVNNICLTNHIIKRYGKNLEEPDGKNEYLSGPILGLEFSGKVDVYDKSGEILELKKLAQWAKKTAHEKEVYRKVIIEFNDISGNEYDSITLEKAFVVRYEQSFDGEKGEGEFYILIRSLDNMDDVFGQAWDSTAWSIDDVIVKAGDTAKIQFASNPLDTEYTIMAQTAEEYQNYIDGLSPDELLNEFRTLSLVGIDVPSMLGMLDTKTKMDMVWNKLHNREQNKNSGDYVLSSQDSELLKKLELEDYQLADIAIYDSNNKLIGMMPYYVMINANTGFKDDGGITIGYGHHINVNEWNNPDNPDHKLLKLYVPSDVEITGITANSQTLPKSGLIVVANSTMIPIDVINDLFFSDVKLNNEKISDWLKEKNITITQKEFDALVIYRYNRGSLSEDAMSYLEAGNRNKDDWKEIWRGGDNRKDKLQELFFGGEY